MADDTQGRGWHGDSEGHARAGSQSSGNQNASQNLSGDARSRGGSMSSGNFRNDPQRAAEMGRKGGRSKRGRNQENQSNQNGSAEMLDEEDMGIL